MLVYHAKMTNVPPAPETNANKLLSSLNDCLNYSDSFVLDHNLNDGVLSFVIRATLIKLVEMRLNLITIVGWWSP